MFQRLTGLRARLRPTVRRGGNLAVGGVVAAGLVAGVLFGDGIARTVVEVSDGVTWLGDDRRGDVVQVNPRTGKPDNRLNVAAPGNDLDIQQRDGLLVVIDRETGTVSLIDLATLLTTGRRQVSPGEDTEVLLAGNRTFLADREQGTITNIDPVSAGTIGQQWRTEDGLADVAVDDAGVLWALGRDAALHKVVWTEDIDRFVEQGERAVDGTGAESALVSHERGVTVLGPEGGVMVQVETGNERAIAVPGLGTPLHAATTSPADLVPAAVEPTGTVVMLRGQEVLEVSVTGVGCDAPGTPAVLGRLVYVPCPGDRKVIVLNENGRSARPDIITPEGGDPELVVDDGRIIVNVPGADTGVVIEPDGSSRTVTTFSPDGEPADPRAPAVEPPAAGPPPASSPPPTAGGPPAGPPISGGPPLSVDPPVVDDVVPAPPPPTTTTPPPPPPDPPTPEEVVPVEVTAQARGDGSVLVSWTPGPARPDRFNVFGQTGDAAEPPLVAQVPGTATSAVVSGLAPATVATFFVLGVPPGYEQGQELPPSPLSNEVTTFTRPGPPSRLWLDKLDQFANPSRLWLAYRWRPGEDNGSPVTHYVITASTETGYTVSEEVAGYEKRGIQLPCTNQDCSDQYVRIQVVAVNAAGAGEPITVEEVFNQRRLS